MNCPACGGVHVVHETKALFYTHDGRAHAAGNVTGHFCQQCGKMLTEQELTEAGSTSQPALVLTDAERAERRKALRSLMGLNKHREGGPVDGLEFQLKQRGEWGGSSTS